MDYKLLATAIGFVAGSVFSRVISEKQLRYFIGTGFIAISTLVMLKA